jgi:DNA-binding PadR family transcriptional regulator
MYELIILSLLMRGPMHGYLIAKVTNDQIGPWAKLSSGTLYTILARLEAEGLIEAAPEPSAGMRRRRGKRQARTFVITEMGRKQFRQIMMDTSSNLGDYQRIFQLKYIYLDLVTHEERVLLLNHYVNYCQTTILYLQTEMGNLVHELGQDSNAGYLQSVLEVMRHISAQWEAELDWVADLRARELAAHTGLSTPGRLASVPSGPDTPA